MRQNSWGRFLICVCFVTQGLQRPKTRIKKKIFLSAFLSAPGLFTVSGCMDKNKFFRPKNGFNKYKYLARDGIMYL